MRGLALLCRRSPVRALRLGLIALAQGLAACGGVAGNSYDDSERAEAMRTPFSDFELELIRVQLGSLPEMPPPDPSNDYVGDPEAALLGQKLFFEKRYSANGQISCASCHIPDGGFQDNRGNTSKGLTFTPRHASSVMNAAYGSGKPGDTIWQFWDGRKDSLWSQALAPPESPVEMGGSRVKVALLLNDKYRRQYVGIFGEMPRLREDGKKPIVDPELQVDTPHWDALDASLRDGITRVYVNFGKAIAAYESLLVSRNSRFDRFYEEIAAGALDSDELSLQEKEGLRVFVGRGGCTTCHRGPNFSDWKFHNVGVSQIGENLPAEDQGRAEGIDLVKEDDFNCASRWSDRADADRCAIYGLEPRSLDLGAFKTPSLRSVSRTAPYFHTGAIATLEEVVDAYDKGGGGTGFAGRVDGNITSLGLSADEKLALVAFLRALDGEPLDPDLMHAPPLPD